MTSALCLLLPLLCTVASTSAAVKSSTTSSTRKTTTSTSTARVTSSSSTARVTSSSSSSRAVTTSSVSSSRTSSTFGTTSSPVSVIVVSTSVAPTTSAAASSSSAAVSASVAAPSSAAASSSVAVSSSAAASSSVAAPSSAVASSSAAALSSSEVASSSSEVSSSSTSSAESSASSSVVLPVGGDFLSTILVIASDSTTAGVATRGLNGYGIPFETLLVPSAGASLPALNSSGVGNYGGIIVVGGVVYDYGTSGYLSALTTDQWNELYAYQSSYGVRMAQYGIFPTADYGVTALGGCCASGVEQLVSFTNTDAFAQAGIKINAGVSTQGLYHYPASIVNTTTTTEIAQFAAASDGSFSGTSTAAVINNFGSREQMVLFVDFAQDWSATSNFLQHAYITWMTRGLYAGYRRVNLNTQIDDVMLATDVYYPGTYDYRITPEDMAGISNWVPTINAKMPAGSSYYPELGYNGNGNLIYSENTTNGATTCSPGSIEYDTVPDTALEFQKPLGSGADFWPATPTAYPYTSSCLVLDPLEVWLTTPANHANFYHITHTFTHLELNNATYADALKEIQFNQQWLSQTGISASRFTSNGLIPPAITGLHNGDVLRAWTAAGLTNCVGDNTRPVLGNTQNAMWPLITTVAANGFDGFQITPRWATRIYYNCDTGACTTQEWIVTSAGSGTFDDLLAIEKSDTMRHLFGLYRDPYMFHQANLRNTGNIGTTTINGVTSTISIFQAWVETVVQEFTRLVNWPVITLKQSDFAAAFAARMARDKCNYKLKYTVSSGAITGITVTATNNQCSSPIPVTVPGSVTNTQGFATEQVGNDPLTIWATLSGSAVTFTLNTPITLVKSS